MTVQNDATFTLECSACGGGQATVEFGQSFRGQELRWYRRMTCPDCGLREEFDDTGFPPEDVRRQIMDANGRWSLHVKQPRSAARLRQTLRVILKLEPAEAIALTRDPRAAVFTGTKVEAEWLAALLHEAGETGVTRAT